jgi:hypothetical protein
VKKMSGASEPFTYSNVFLSNWKCSAWYLALTFPIMLKAGRMSGCVARAWYRISPISATGTVGPVGRTCRNGSFVSAESGILALNGPAGSGRLTGFASFK